MENEKKVTGYPSIDKPWLKYYSDEAINAPLPECTVFEYIWEHNNKQLQDNAIYYFNRKISYGELFDNIEKTASALASVGVKAGDIVTLNLPSTPEMTYVFYALSRLGAVANIIDPRADKDMLKYYLKEAESKVFIFLDQCMPIVKTVLPETAVETAVCVSATESLPIINLLHKTGKSKNEFITWKQFIRRGIGTPYIESKDYTRPVLMTHTSGTTGMPKGVLLSHMNVNAVAHQYSVGMDHSRDQCYLCTIPPFIAFGICVAVHMPLGLGMKDALIPKFESEKFLSYLRKYKPQHFVCAPMSLDPLINTKCRDDLSFLRLPGVGGDYINPEYEEKVNRFLTSHGCRQPLLKGYGMTEVSSSACTTSDRCNALGSVGVPLVLMSISVFKVGTTEELSYGEEGEICFTGPNTMLGYFKNPEATAEVLKLHPDGKVWMHSGDIGYMNSDGLVYVIDRLKRSAMLDGNLILPSKAERLIINEFKEVSKCSAVTSPDASLAVFCVMSGNDGNDNTLKEEIIKTCSSKLPDYMKISKVVFIDSLPLTPVGKVDFKKLEELAAKTE